MTVHPIPYGETITLHRTEITGVDEYGNDITEATDIVVFDVALWPRSSGTRESRDSNQSTVVVGLTALVPPGVDVKATDRVTARQELWEVDGEPGIWRSYLTATQAGTEIALRRVEG